MSMRIIGGIYRNRRLSAPPGRDVRPTPERAREALFSILGGNLEGHTFLDLFAGAGTVGLEAVSRNAERAIFVEQDRRAVQSLRGNISALGCGDRCEVLEMPAGKAGPEVLEQASVIFLDPPYGDPPRLPRLGEFLAEAEEPPVVIYQWDARLRPRGGERVPPEWIPDRIPLLDERRYGRTIFSLYSMETDE